MTEYQLFNDFVRTFLVEGKDFLSRSSRIVLTPKNLEEAISLFIENAIEGSDQDFATKFLVQFSGASEGAKILFANATWLYVFCNRSMTPEGKKNAIELSLQGISDYRLRDDIYPENNGIAHGGTGYNTAKFGSLSFILLLFKWIKGSKGGNDYSSIIKAITNISLYMVYDDQAYLDKSFDPKKVRLIVSDSNVLRGTGGKIIKLGVCNFLLNLCVPDYYERIISYNDKRLIAAKLFKPEYGSRDGLNIDDQIYVIKQELIKEYPGIDPLYLLYDDRIRPLWKDEKKEKCNYWLFQCNPGFYDLVSALHDGAIASWKVSSHKSDLKVGDKVILWMTGEAAGCYALAEISGELESGLTDEKEEQYYKDDSYQVPSDRIPISLTHNLANNPILKPQISAHPKLADMKTGLQGTNFTAKKKHYEALEDIATQSLQAQDNSVQQVTKKEDSAMNQTSTTRPLNQILYGPPGTGKTYNSINLAVEIADPEFMKTPRTRDDIRKRYQELVKAGRIVFTTFHQSMSYEDFIEGIKPVTQDNGQIQYDVLDGLFKQIGTLSMYNLYRFVTSKNTVIQDDDFASLYQQLLSDIEDKKGDQPYEFTTKSDSVIQLVDVSSKDNLQVKHKDSSGPQTYIVSKDRLFKLFKIYNSVEQIKNVYNDIREAIGGADTSAYYSVLKRIFEIRDTSHNGTQASKSLGLEDNDLMKVALEGFNLPKEVLEATPSNGVKNYILIIDEINRGNVSQIFGELITLIEPDKRAGMKEALEVTLPYSKEKFSVPPNLYIIGTMNTADRSVEALDTALRRRFTFKEFPPLTEIKDDQGNDLMAKVLCDYSMKEILTTINSRIRILLDRDHQIGHSYFLDPANEQELMEVFNQKIIPLLQEYFYGDYAKIGLVLGTGFVEKEELGVAELSDFVYDDKESLVKDNYKIRIPKDVAEFKEAIHLMMLGKNGQEQS